MKRLKFYCLICNSSLPRCNVRLFPDSDRVCSPLRIQSELQQVGDITPRYVVTHRIRTLLKSLGGKAEYAINAFHMLRIEAVALLLYK